MSETRENSIFQRYYSREPFVDRFASDPSNAIDVLIPIIHTNELWEANLISIYREIPVNRLLLGDGGCIDDSIRVTEKFPRVEVLDHRQFKTLGYSIRNLIENVETEWFAYLHSDVFLPEGWFDTMRSYQGTYEWFGCPMRITALIEYPNVDRVFDEVRPYAGSQMGLKSAFIEGLKRIDDDFVYRQEDFVFADVIRRAGYREGRIENTFHYHQMIHKESPWSRKLKKVSVEVEWSDAERIRAAMMQVKGLVKYLEPSINLVREAQSHLEILIDLKAIDLQDFHEWVVRTNPRWAVYLDPARMRKKRYVRRVLSGLKSMLSSVISGVGER